jgi:hypothetical protein
VSSPSEPPHFDFRHTGEQARAPAGHRPRPGALVWEFGPRGIRVAHVVIDGQIDLPRTRAQYPERSAETFLSPDAIAETYYDLHLQTPTAWTHELDLRPAVERF